MTLTEKQFAKKRCFGNKPGQEFYALYHDNEWAIPKHDERELFELLILEGAQAGLSWLTILKKRTEYKIAFQNFQPQIVANMSDAQLEKLILNSNIIRNRKKIFAARQNAKVFCDIQQKYETFDKYIWQFVDGKPIINQWDNAKQVPANTKKSHIISDELKKKGMKFVGPTIIYSYMQAIGMVNDHPKDCWKYGI